MICFKKIIICFFMDRFVEIRTIPFSSDNGLLETKYGCATTAEWIENEDQLRNLRGFLSNPDKRLVVVTGEGGTGKTKMVNLLVNELGIGAYHYNRNQTTSHDLLFGTVQDAGKLLIIDDLESFFIHVESVTPKQLIMHVCAYDLKMILIINELQMTKLITLLAKQTYDIVRLERPSVSSLLVKCQTICVAERFAHDESTLHQYIVANNCNYRYIVNGLKHYKTLSCVSKFNQIGMYDAYVHAVKSEKLEDRLKYFQLEPGTVPIIAHENIFDMKMSLPSLCNVLENMSLADVYHKQFFPYSDELHNNTYGVLSTIFLSLHNPVLKKPRFGIVWTKQAAKFQKRKYLCDFIVSNRMRPISVMEFFHLFIILNEIVATRASFLKPFVDSLKCKNVQSLFSVYNGFTLRENKKITKKSFLDLLA